MNPDVTVCICTYNRALMLKESLQSVIKQTYENIRIVVLDNCSEDNTEEVVRSFGDVRVLYVRHEENIGGFQNWNAAIEICDTKYLVIFHDDDRMFPWMIETERSIMENNSDVGLVASTRFFSLNDETKSREFNKPFSLPFHKYQPHELIREHCRIGYDNIIAPSVMFRKSCLDEYSIRFRPSEGLAADWYCWLECNLFPFAAYLVDYPFLEYRTHPGSGTSQCAAAEDMWIHSYRGIEKLLEQNGYGAEMKVLREGFASAILKYAIAGRGRGDVTRELLYEIAEKIATRTSWKLNSYAFNDACAVGILAEPLSKAIAGKITFNEYRKAVRDYQARGFSLSVKRRLLWLIKIFIFKFHLEERISKWGYYYSGMRYPDIR